MNCKLVYYLIPIEPLDKTLEDQARLIARKRVELINHSMQLEKQGLTPVQLKQQEKSLVQELLQGNIKKLWNEQWLFDKKNKAIVQELKEALKQKADRSIDLSCFED